MSTLVVDTELQERVVSVLRTIPLKRLASEAGLYRATVSGFAKTGTISPKAQIALRLAVAVLEVAPSRIHAGSTLSERFWAHVEAKTTEECWIWQGAKNPKGYGLLKVKKGTIAGIKGRTCLAHRAAFFLRTGEWPMPYGCHKCNNPSCVNPDHIYAGTPLDNSNDKQLRGKIYRSNAKLKEADIPEILRRSLGGETNRSIADSLGVSGQTIASALSGRCWGSVGKRPLGKRQRRLPMSVKLTEARVLEIKKAFELEGCSYIELGHRFGVKGTTIKRVVIGDTWPLVGATKQQVLETLTLCERCLLGVNWQRDPISWVYIREDGWRVECLPDRTFVARFPGGELLRTSDSVSCFSDPDQAKQAVDTTHPQKE